MLDATVEQAVPVPAACDHYPASSSWGDEMELRGDRRARAHSPGDVRIRREARPRMLAAVAVWGVGRPERMVHYGCVTPMMS